MNNVNNNEQKNEGGCSCTLCTPPRSAPEYRAITPQTVLSNAEKNKKKKYLAMCEEKHELHPTLFYHMIDGLIGSEAESFIKRLVEQLSDNSQQS